MKSKTSSMLAGCVLVAALCGCESQPQTPEGDGTTFAPDNDRQVWTALNTQASLGAHNEPMQPMHFDGNALNSLGRAKLDAMVNPDPTAQTVVYMNLDAQDTMTSARRDAVTAYLLERGSEADRIHVETGINPAVGRSPAVAGLSRMAKTESPSARAAGGTSASSGPPASGNGTRVQTEAAR